MSNREFGGARVYIQHASDDTGVVQSPVGAVLEAAGVQNVLSKSQSSSTSQLKHFHYPQFKCK